MALGLANSEAMNTDLLLDQGLVPEEGISGASDVLDQEVGLVEFPYKYLISSENSNNNQFWTSPIQLNVVSKNFPFSEAIMDKPQINKVSLSSDVSTIYDEESQSDKLARKVKESPFIVAGFLGFAGVVTYGFYGIRQRKLPLSVYLIHMRVCAQGFVVSCVTLGVVYQMFQKYIYPKFNSKGDSSSLEK